MEITITGRQMTVTPTLKKYIEGQAQKIGKYGSKPPQVTFTLHVQKYRHIAEAHVNANGVVLQAEEETDNMHASVDQVIAKIERQLKKSKEKGVNHRVRPTSGGKRGAAKGVRASVVPGDGNGPTEAFETVEREPVSVAVMTLEEALLQMKADKKEFLLFRNKKGRQWNLLYKKREGALLLMEPADSAS